LSGESPLSPQHCNRDAARSPRPEKHGVPYRFFVPETKLGDISVLSHNLYHPIERIHRALASNAPRTSVSPP
jgi:hypothetical protein